MKALLLELLSCVETGRIRRLQRGLLLAACLAGTLLPSEPVNAQWSVSVLAESTLYVCPGFYPGLISFSDGGCIVVGILQSYIFAGKLDPFGNQVWTIPAQVHHNDSSFITDSPPSSEQDWGDVISDGDGGVIIAWYDHRGGERDPQSYRWMNNSIYAQHIDRYGVVRWNPDGVLIEGPQRGLKTGKIVTDGSGGFIMVWTEDGFQHPGIPDKYYLRAARFDSLGVKTWEVITDSSTSSSDSFGIFRAIRGGQRVYFDYYAGGNWSRVISLQGSVLTLYPGNPSATIASEKDSVIFVTEYPTISRSHKLGPLGDTLWSVDIQLPDSCLERGWYFVPDGGGGAYLRISCGDTLIHVSDIGMVRKKLFGGSRERGRAFPESNRGLVFSTTTTAARYDSTGTEVWPSPVLYLVNPNDTYFRRGVADYNGGVIVAFWTTAGGIFAHHTGRTGSVGVITSVISETPSHRPGLFQNYPNPFNPTTTIRYTLSNPGLVSLRVYDLLGREVRRLVDEVQNSGSHTAVCDASGMASGVYFYKLQAGAFTAVRRMVVVR